MTDCLFSQLAMQPLLRAPPPLLPDAARPGPPARWGAGEAAGSAGSGTGRGTGGARSWPGLGGGTAAPASHERSEGRHGAGGQLEVPT